MITEEQKSSSHTEESLKVVRKETTGSAEIPADMVFQNAPASETQEKQKLFIEYYQQLVQCFSQPNLHEQAMELIKNIIDLTRYPIKITFEILEEFLQNTLYLPRGTQISKEAYSFLDLIFCTRRNLSLLIYDSQACVTFVEMVQEPMEIYELNALKSYISSIDTNNNPFGDDGFLTRVIQLALESTSEQHLLQLLDILYTLVISIPPNNEYVEPLIPVITKYIQSNGEIYKSTLHLLTVMLEEFVDSTLLYNFIIEQNYDGVLIDSFAGIEENVIKDYVLRAIRAVSGCSKYYANALYQKQITQKLVDIASISHDNQLKYIYQIVINLISLNAEVVLEIANMPFTENGLNLIDEGTFKVKKIVVQYFCAICLYIENQDIQGFLIRNGILQKMIEFLEMPKPKLWNSIVMTLMHMISKLSAETDDVFSHPVMESFDQEQLYESLCEIDGKEYLFKCEQNKALKLNVVNLLDLYDSVRDEDEKIDS